MKIKIIIIIYSMDKMVFSNFKTYLKIILICKTTNKIITITMIVIWKIAPGLDKILWITIIVEETIAPITITTTITIIIIVEITIAIIISNNLIISHKIAFNIYLGKILELSPIYL